MTKLMQWIAGLAVFLAIYIPMLTGLIRSPFLDQFEREVKLFPFMLIGLFGVHSINTVLFRAATIRDCNEAEVELQEQIKEARQDLTKKGFKWR